MLRRPALPPTETGVKLREPGEAGISPSSRHGVSNLTCQGNLNRIYETLHTNHSAALWSHRRICSPNSYGCVSICGRRVFLQYVWHGISRPIWKIEQAYRVYKRSSCIHKSEGHHYTPPFTSLTARPSSPSPHISPNMKLTILLPVLACATSVQSALTWSLTKASNPSADQSDAYAKIEAAMRLAVARYDRLGTATKNIRVAYVPGVPTAEAK